MNREHGTPVTSSDLVLPGGCMLCGGDLAMRIAPGAAASYCGSCHWISRPHLVRDESGVQVVHPAGAVA